MYCRLHDLSEHNSEDCNIFRQIVKSTIGKGRLKFVETQIDDHSILVGLDGKRLLRRLPQANSFNDEKEKTADVGIQLSCE